MRSTFLILLAILPAAAGAQRRPLPDRQQLPGDVRREVAEKWNRANAVRSSDRLEIEPGQEINGDVAVQRGPLIIAGHVVGSVLAVNSDVLLRPSARIDGNLLVVGGEVEGRNTGYIGGSVRIYRQSLVYRMEGDHMIAADSGSRDEPSWWQRFELDHDSYKWSEALRVVQAGPYNRVEGLPIQLGPFLNRRTNWGAILIDPAAVLRTGSSFSSAKADVGYNVRSEVRKGDDNGFAVGGRMYSVVDPIEDWQLSDLEVALGAFLVRRDYRDYYQRHGTTAYVTLYGAPNLSLAGSYGAERWSSREAGNPFALFKADDPWRPNPAVDEGVFHLANLALAWDTRTDPLDPWSGWLIDADIEHGRGSIETPAPSADPQSVGRIGLTSYTRGFFDVRRYNRLGPNAQLNMRVVLGGWMHGDPLPLERRLSVDGPGVLPGFDFRSSRGGRDVGTCSAGLGVPGSPAECERIALGQVEYRGDLHLDVMDNLEDYLRQYLSAHGGIAWVLFADAGRGWLLGPADDGVAYGNGTLPPLSTFRADLGIGIDLAGIGVYAAKAVSTPSQPVNFFIRLRHRF